MSEEQNSGSTGATGSTGGSLWTRWIIPLVIVAGLVGAFGFGIAATLEIPFSQAVVWAIPAVVIVGGYFFAEHWVYAVAVRPMGYRCEMRPQPRPHSAKYDADLVITGNFRGRPFTLYRERHNSMSTGSTPTPSPIIRSVVEWPDLAFTAPPFELRVGDSGAGPPGFSQSSRDQLKAIMGGGVIEGSPGYLVLRETARSPVWTSREGKFPYPWEIEAYLDRADRIRHVFVS